MKQNRSRAAYKSIIHIQMSIKNIAENNLVAAENKPNQSKLTLKSFALPFQLLILALGIGLLVFVVRQIGLPTIREAFDKVGWGFLIVLLLSGGRHFLRALCLYLAVPATHRTFKYRYALAARLGGEAVSFLTFTGPLLGEATKAALLKNRLPLAQGVTAIVVDNILYDMSVLVMILAGVLLMFSAYGNGDHRMNEVMFGIVAVGLIVGIALFLMAKYRVKPLTALLNEIEKRGWMPKFLAKKKENIFQVEADIFQFYETRRMTFYAISLIIFVSHALSVAEVFIALRLLGFDTTVVNSYIIESLTKVINMVFSFVPATVGVYEGGNGIILHSLGFAVATGVMLALVRRGAMLFWMFVGVIILLRRTFLRGTRRLTAGGKTMNS